MEQSITLKEAAAQYIQHLTNEGQKASTLGTARRTLDLLIEEMGEQKEVGKILTVHVAAFLKSEAATMLKGKPRAEASVLQIRRIVRAALVWFHEQGWLEVLPLPKDEKRFLERGKGKKVEATEQLEASTDVGRVGATEQPKASTDSGAEAPVETTAEPAGE